MTSGLQANLFRKTQKEASQPQNQTQCPETLLLICPPGAQGCYGNRSLALQIQALFLLSQVRTCRANVAIASPAASFLPWGLQPTGHNSWSCSRAPSMEPLVPRAAHSPRASEHSSLHVCAALSERETEHGSVRETCGMEPQQPVACCQQGAQFLRGGSHPGEQGQARQERDSAASPI